MKTTKEKTMNSNAANAILKCLSLMAAAGLLAGCATTQSMTTVTANTDDTQNWLAEAVNVDDSWKSACKEYSFVDF